MDEYCKSNIFYSGKTSSTIPESLSSQWELIRNILRSCSIIRSMPQDFLIWNLSNANSQVCVKNIYADMIGSKPMPSYPSFPPTFWKSGCAPKFFYFSWLVFYNKNLSWENLRKRQWHGPSRCQMCELEEESNVHMFFQCSCTQQIWQDLAFVYGFPLLQHVSTHAAFDWWSRQRDSWR